MCFASPSRECRLCACAAGFLRPESCSPCLQLRDHAKGTAATATAAAAATKEEEQGKDVGFWLRVPHLEGGLPLSGQGGWIYLRLQQALLAGQHRPPRGSWQGEAPTSPPHLLTPAHCSPTPGPALRDLHPNGRVNSWNSL